jgi:hypothetical protein
MREDTQENRSKSLALFGFRDFDSADEAYRDHPMRIPWETERTRIQDELYYSGKFPGRDQPTQELWDATNERMAEYEKQHPELKEFLSLQKRVRAAWSWWMEGTDER